MGKKLYLECYCGISGDMTVASLIDLGADKDILLKALKSLNVDGFDIEIKRVKKSGLDACDFNVILDDHHQNHDHDMEYLHNEHKKAEEHSHKHRLLQDILTIINNADISDTAKHISAHIFDIIAEAEATAHGVNKNEVHFHEVGAVDSIVDIVAVSVCLDNLDISQVYITELYEGRGLIRCQHGMLPIPVPAVINIVKSNNLKLHITETEGELITPTGAAIAAAIRTNNNLPETFLIKKIGIGAGKRNYERPSMVRAMIIE